MFDFARVPEIGRAQQSLDVFELSCYSLFSKLNMSEFINQFSSGYSRVYQKITLEIEYCALHEKLTEIVSHA